MNKAEIKQIILEEIEAALNEMASPEHLAADSRPEDDDIDDGPEYEDLYGADVPPFITPEEYARRKLRYAEKQGKIDSDYIDDLDEMARTSNVFKLSQEASMKDVLQFMQRVNDVLKTYKSPGQKRPKKRFTPEEMKALATAMLKPEGFTSKDVIASTSYNSPAQANKFLKALEMKGLITLTSQLKKSMEPTRDPDAPETRGRKRRDAEFDMSDDPMADLDALGLGGSIDLSDPLAENKLGKLINEISIEKAAAAVRAARQRKEFKRAEDISNMFFRTFVGKNMTFGKIESIELDGQIFSDSDIDKGSVAIRIDVDGVSDEDKMKLLRYNNENPDRSLPRIFSNQPFDVPSNKLMNYPPELQTLRDDSGKPVVLGPAITGDQYGFSYYGQGSGINLRYFMGADNITYNQGGANVNIAKLPLSRRDVRILQQVIKVINPDSKYAKPGTSEYKVVGLRENKNNNTMSELEKYIKKVIKEAKNPLATKMKEIETQGRVAALETKLAAVAEMIEETEGRLTRIDEDNEFRDMMDKNAVKEVRKQLKELERAQAKLQKEYDKVSGGRKKEKVVDELDAEETRAKADKFDDLADRQDALDQEAGEVEEVSFELNESVKRMQKLANILKG